MPRGRPNQRAQRKAIMTMRCEQMCHDAIATRRAHHAREATFTLRKATPDSVDLDAQLKHTAPTRR